MSGEYIDRENITERLERVIAHGVPNARGTHSITAEAALEVIRDIPAANVVEVRHGRWVFNDELDDMFHCTVCDNVAVRNTLNYCPHCGAKMDGGQKDV